MPLTRVARTAAATLAHTFTVDEIGTDSTTTVTVAATSAGGTSVASGNATSAGQGRYTFPLPGQAALNLLAVSWSATIAGTAVTESDTVEIVGGFFFTLQEGRNSDTSLGDPGKYPTADLATARTEVEVECEEICDRSFVPRYGRAVLDGTGTTGLVLPGVNDLRAIRSVSMASRADGTFVPLTGPELAALVANSDRTLERVDGRLWTEGRGNVIVEYEHGLDSPPADLRRAALVRLKSTLNVNKSSIPDRALSYTTGDGTSYRLSLPAAYRTGIPYVDGIYSRYSLRAGEDTDGGVGQPASRRLDFDPQYHSIFHGGRR